MVTVHCFFSGGRDSSLACYIAKKLADTKRWGFKLVHIDTTISLQLTQQYVRRYVEWLNAELVVIRPKMTFVEYARKIGMWPSLRPPKFRWCYRELKLRPVIKYVRENYSRGDLLVMGIKGPDSRFRLKNYTSTFMERKYGRVVTKVWLPLLRVDDKTVERLINKFGIPRNPVWRLGFSGECLCLAAAPLNVIALTFRYFPAETQLLLSIDRDINTNRRSNKTSAPFPVYGAGFKTLTEFYKHVMSQTTLDQYLDQLVVPYGKSCQGSCML
jgi:3'-phosphoadenosine 5'-phosphosulfate sulfotransferase (PAPS reductase)/FAD synthetase